MLTWPILSVCPFFCSAFFSPPPTCFQVTLHWISQRIDINQKCRPTHSLFNAYIHSDGDHEHKPHLFPKYIPLPPKICLTMLCLWIGWISGETFLYPGCRCSAGVSKTSLIAFLWPTSTFDLPTPLSELCGQSSSWSSIDTKQLIIPGCIKDV